jgi:1,4-dihydroxy-2-naphthoyl-CoA hydrolase
MDLQTPDHGFIHEFRVGLHDTDAAGVMFFGHLFRHLHDAYESFMDGLGFPLHTLIRAGDPAAGPGLPIVHAQADYRSPLRHGDRVRVTLRVAEVRTRSFALEYAIDDLDGRACARARTVHVAVAPQTAAPPGLPEGLRLALSARRLAPPASVIPPPFPENGSSTSPRGIE